MNGQDMAEMVTYLGNFKDGLFDRPFHAVTPTMYIYKFTEEKRTLPVRCKDDLLYFLKRKEFRVDGRAS